MNASGNDVSTEFAGVEESIKVKYNWTNRTITVAILGACAFFGYTGNILNNVIGGAVFSKAAAFTAFGGGMAIIIGTAVLCLVVASIGVTRFEEAKNREQCASTLKKTQAPAPAASISDKPGPQSSNSENEQTRPIIQGTATIRKRVTFNETVERNDGTQSRLKK